jgi:PhnB protein
MNNAAAIPTTIAPWLSVRNGARALDFYKAAFGATEVFRMEDGSSVVARLSVEGAEFWLGDESPEHFNFSPQSIGGSSVRIILTAADPMPFSLAPWLPARRRFTLSVRNTAGA